MTPPWVADQTLELGGVLPIGPKSFGESGFEVVQGVEDGVGEDPAQGLEPALRRVEFGAVGLPSISLAAPPRGAGAAGRIGRS